MIPSNPIQQQDPQSHKPEEHRHNNHNHKVGLSPGNRDGKIHVSTVDNWRNSMKHRYVTPIPYLLHR
jgi:hypothetical protein